MAHLAPLELSDEDRVELERRLRSTTAAQRDVNRAAAGLDALDSLDSLDATLLEDYQPYHATRADLLARAGRRDATVAAYDRAIELTASPAERRFLERQRNATAERT